MNPSVERVRLFQPTAKQTLRIAHLICSLCS